jgi:hypothetical protein
MQIGAVGLRGCPVFTGLRVLRTSAYTHEHCRNRAGWRTGWRTYAYPVPQLSTSFIPVVSDSTDWHAEVVTARDVLEHAQRSGRRVTPVFVEDRLAALRSHPPTCRCGQCGPAVNATPTHVFAVASIWQRRGRARPERADTACVCRVCGATFRCRRRDGQYCSARCRQAATRRRRASRL